MFLLLTSSVSRTQDWKKVQKCPYSYKKVCVCHCVFKKVCANFVLKVNSTQKNIQRHLKSTRGEGGGSLWKHFKISNLFQCEFLWIRIRFIRESSTNICSLCLFYGSEADVQVRMWIADKVGNVCLHRNGPMKLSTGRSTPGCKLDWFGCGEGCL